MSIVPGVTPITTTDLDSLLGSGRLDELSRALDDEALELDALDRHRLRGELARRRRGPVSDLIAAARAHRAAATSHAARLLASAAQALSRLGGDALAQKLLGELPAMPASAPAPGAEERTASLGEAASRARGFGELAEAARCSAAAVAAAVGSDESAAVCLTAALDAWAAGHGEALAALRAVRDDEAAPSPVRRQARDVLDVVESEPARAPSWLFARMVTGEASRPGRELPGVRSGGLLPLLGRAFGVTIVDRPVPTASHVRAALCEAGVETLHVVLDQELLIRLLGEPGLMLILEEEKSRDSSFLVVRGLERTGGLVLVTDPAVGGATLRSLAEQWRRSALPGRGALVATGTGPAGAARRRVLDEAGVVDDPRLALIDRCHFDPDDPDVPLAQVARLAGQAIAAAPEIPMAHKRLGEALLGLLRRGNLQPQERRMERWVAETRERFPDAGWAHQIHAEALECGERWAEAFISWHDATSIDPDDDRNLMGQARAARHLGRPSGGKGHCRGPACSPFAEPKGGFGRRELRRALAANPTDALAWTWLAEAELAADRLADAAIAADLAAALVPHAVPVRLLQTRAAERRGALGQATLLLERVADGAASTSTIDRPEP